jgi:hypothetical protein
VRQTLAIFFIIALSLPSLYKAGLISFYKLGRGFIAENYCVNKDQPITMCYGKCFLERGLSLADQIPSSKNLVSQVKFESSEFEYVSITASLFFEDVFSIYTHISTSRLRDGIALSVFRPPHV